MTTTASVEIGRAQIPVFGIVKRKIDQPVVDEIDRRSLSEQLTALVAELISIDDHRVDAVLLKEALSQQELRIEILLRRPVVDDGDPPRNSLPVLQFPLVL